MRKKNYYNILGVPRGAAPEDIKRAYRRLAMKFHPDHNPGVASAHAKFQQILEAYSVLSDSVRRAEYDRGLRGEKPESPRQEPPRSDRSASLFRSEHL